MVQAMNYRQHRLQGKIILTHTPIIWAVFESTLFQQVPRDYFTAAHFMAKASIKACAMYLKQVFMRYFNQQLLICIVWSGSTKRPSSWKEVVIANDKMPLLHSWWKFMSSVLCPFFVGENAFFTVLYSDNKSEITKPKYFQLHTFKFQWVLKDTIYSRLYNSLQICVRDKMSRKTPWQPRKLLSLTGWHQETKRYLTTGKEKKSKVNHSHQIISFTLSLCCKEGVDWLLICKTINNSDLLSWSKIGTREVGGNRTEPTKYDGWRARVLGYFFNYEESRPSMSH